MSVLKSEASKMEKQFINSSLISLSLFLTLLTESEGSYRSKVRIYKRLFSCTDCSNLTRGVSLYIQNGQFVQRLNRGCYKTSRAQTPGDRNFQPQSSLHEDTDLTSMLM